LVKNGIQAQHLETGRAALFFLSRKARAECSNYRTITLLSIPGKVYAHVLLARIKSHLQQLRRKEQSGFDLAGQPLTA